MGVALEVALQLSEVTRGQMFDLGEVAFDGPDLPPQVQETLVARDVVVVESLHEGVISGVS